MDNNLEIEGEAGGVARAESILEDYNALIREGHVFTNGDLNSYLRVVTGDPEVSLRGLVHSGKQRNFGKTSGDSHAGQAAICTRSVDCSVCSLLRAVQFAVDHVLSKAMLRDLLQNEEEMNSWVKATHGPKELYSIQ